MRLFAVELLLSLCMTLLPFTTDNRQASCKCRPIPPGGETTCASGQTAICSARDGVCKGSCVSLSAQLQPLQYSAELLSHVSGRKITAADLTKDKSTSKHNIEQLLKSNKKDETVKLKDKGKEFFVDVGLTEVSVDKLKAALKLLSVTTINIPFRVGRP